MLTPESRPRSRLQCNDAVVDVGSGLLDAQLLGAQVCQRVAAGLELRQQVVVGGCDGREGATKEANDVDKAGDVSVINVIG